MPDLPSYPDTGDDAGAGPDRESATGSSRWAKLFGIIIAIALIMLFVVLHVTGAVGPGGH